MLSIFFTRFSLIWLCSSFYSNLLYIYYPDWREYEAASLL